MGGLETRMSIKALLKRIARAGSPSAAKRLVDVLDHRVDAVPSVQTAVDALIGWNHPPLIGADGRLGLYADARIDWCLDRAGPLGGRHVLELGPLDGAHTCMLARAGPASLVAIEANSLAFLRCLVAKEVMDLKATSILLGDFNAWMSRSTTRYDLVVASGILYHSSDPIRLIELICDRAASFYLWTHYFDEVAMKAADLRRAPFSGRVRKRYVGGRAIELHERSYFRAWRDSRFCGGFQDRHYWMTRDDIVWMIGRLGFTCEFAHDELDHANGPAFSLFARRAEAS